MSVDKQDRLQAIGASIESIANSLLDQTENFNNNIAALQQASRDFNIPELKDLAFQLSQGRDATNGVASGVTEIASRVRQLSSS